MFGLKISSPISSAKNLEDTNVENVQISIPPTFEDIFLEDVQEEEEDREYERGEINIGERDKRELSKPKPTPIVTPEPLEDKVVRLSIITDFFDAGYDQYWKDEVEILHPDCTDCTAKDIDNTLGKAFTRESWSMVKTGNVFYTHSGWNQEYGPELGDVFKRLYNESSYDLIFCLDDICYQLAEYFGLSRSQVGDTFQLNDLFEDIEQDDIFIVTCDSGIIPGLSTPKIIIKMEPLN